MRALKDDECVNLWREILPRIIGAGKMAAQGSERSRLRIDFERNMVGIEPA